MGREKKLLGKLGEKIASRYLKIKGYRIICRNFASPFGEIDIVARKDRFIIFIEVKTRSSASLGPPYLSVTRKKQMNIVKNALFYLKRYGLAESNWRIDVVSVKLDIDHKLESIEIIENAVEENT